VRDEFHINSGSPHHIENTCTDTAEFIITFRNELHEDFGRDAAFGAMTDGVLRNTYVLPLLPSRRALTSRNASAPSDCRAKPPAN
jgi:oxalate decarboxylase